MQSEQPRDNSPNSGRHHDSKNGRRGTSDSEPLKQPERDPSRAFQEHNPLSLCFHNVSEDSLRLLLSEMLPEVAPIVAECLRQTILRGESIPYQTLLDSYVDLTPFSIAQFSSFRLGRGPAEETSHRMIVERRTEEEPSVFELRLSHTKAHSVDFMIAYPWMEVERRWENVNAWGALAGIESLSSIFNDAPPELCEVDRFGVCTSLLTADISIRTAQAVVSSTPSTGSSAQSTISTRWIPKSIQIAAPLYGEQADILSLLSADLPAMIVESGLLPTINAFGGKDAELQKRLLDRSSSRMTTEVSIEFSRLVHLGPSGTEPFDEAPDLDALCEGKGTPTTFTNDNEDETLESSEDDDTAFSAHPLTMLPVSSNVTVRLFSDQLGHFQLEWLSVGRPHGFVHIEYGQEFNFAVPVLAVTFIDEKPAMRDIAARWRVMRLLALVGGMKIDRRTLEANLSLSAVTPAGNAVAADAGGYRVLMSFEPPTDRGAFEVEIPGE